MAFHSLNYLLFFAAVLLLHNHAIREVFARQLFLTIASLLFYMSWDWHFGWVLGLTLVLDYLAGRGMGFAKRVWLRRLFLALSLSGNLGLLVFFKYSGFLISSLQSLANVFSFPWSAPSFKILLPIGISFFTFQSLAYAIDVYRRKIEPETSFLRYAFFISFFPQLIAGPIVRAGVFLPQLLSWRPPDLAASHRGLFLILRGLLKKVVIADFLAAHLVDRVFSAPHLYSGFEALLAVYAYAFQIYNDFSGYTDIAIGSALLLGYHLPENFHQPYLAYDLKRFWERWHISLSQWIRDYVYFTLGGSRKGLALAAVNTILTMLLCGLWHGAGWTFIFWGLLHGLGLVANRFVLAQGERLSAKWTWLKNRGSLLFLRALGILVTFQFVCLSWIFFRSADFSAAGQMLSKIFDPSHFYFKEGLRHVDGQVWVVLFAALAGHLIPARGTEKLQELFHRSHWALQTLTLVLVTVALFLMSRQTAAPFIYFQF